MGIECKQLLKGCITKIENKTKKDTASLLLKNTAKLNKITIKSRADDFISKIEKRRKLKKMTVFRLKTVILLEMLRHSI